MSAERLRLAENLLQEAVYQARARAAAGAGALGRALDEPTGPGRCGLGRPAEVEPELTEHGRELLSTLWPQPMSATRRARLCEVVAGWVERSDAFDRQRNHFLRDFRTAHGFDRRSYSSEEAHAFEAGLERIRCEANERMRAAAEGLVADG